MADSESSDPGKHQPRANEQAPSQSTPVRVSTADPVIEEFAADESAWNHDLTAVGQVETTQVGEPSPLFVPGVRRLRPDAERENVDRKCEPKHARGAPGDSSDRHDKAPGKTRADERNKPPDPGENGGDQAGRESRRHAQKPSIMHLLLAGVVGLLGGLVAAAGYSHFAGAKSDQASEKSQAKHDSGRNGKKSQAARTDSGVTEQAGANPTRNPLRRPRVPARSPALHPPMMRKPSKSRVWT